MTAAKSRTPRPSGLGRGGPSTIERPATREPSTSRTATASPRRRGRSLLLLWRAVGVAGDNVAFTVRPTIAAGVQPTVPIAVGLALAAVAGATAWLARRRRILRPAR